MPVQALGELTAVSVAALNGGAVAQVVVDERTQAFARLHSDGAWSGWWPVAGGVRDVSVTAGDGQDEPSALIAVVVQVPVPMGVLGRVGHTLYQQAFFHLTASGVVPADL